MIRGLVLAALLLGACKKDEAAPKGPPPLTEGERARGEQLCDTYERRVCACADAKGTDDLKNRCAMAPGRNEAIEAALRTEVGTDVSPTDVVQAQDAARKVMASCVRDLSKLDQDGCP